MLLAPVKGMTVCCQLACCLAWELSGEKNKESHNNGACKRPMEIENRMGHFPALPCLKPEIWSQWHNSNCCEELTTPSHRDCILLPWVLVYPILTLTAPQFSPSPLHDYPLLHSFNYYSQEVAFIPVTGIVCNCGNSPHWSVNFISSLFNYLNANVEVQYVF